MFYYHGTDKTFAQFEKGCIGYCTMSNTEGFWFSENKYAAEWYGSKILTVNLSFQNPLRVTEEDFIKGYPNGPTFWARKAKSLGFDAAILEQITDGDCVSTVICVFEPEQILIVKTEEVE